MITKSNTILYELDRSEIEKFYKISSSKNKFIIDHPDQISERYFVTSDRKLKYVIGKIDSEFYHNETGEVYHKQKFSVVIDMETFWKNSEGFYAMGYESFDEENVETLIDNFEKNDQIYLNLNYKYNKILRNKFI